MEDNFSKIMNSIEKCDWYEVSRNPNVTWNLIKDHIHKELDWNFLSRTIPWSDIEPNLEKGSWSWKYISLNPSVTWQIVQSKPFRPWNYFFMCENPNITPKIFHRYFTVSSSVHLAKNPSFTLNDLKKICATVIPLTIFFSENPNITEDILSDPVCKNINVWRYLSGNPHISADFIRKHSDKEWDWTILSRNPNLPFDVVLKLLDKPWQWFFISQNPTITLETVQKYNYLEWKMGGIYLNPNVKWEYIKNVDITDPFEWSCACRNPNITLDIIQSNPGKNWNSVVKNKFDKNIPYKVFQKNKIVHAYRRYRLRKRLRVVANKYRVNGEIKYMPNLGVEFFRLKDEMDSIFEEIKLNF